MADPQNASDSSTPETAPGGASGGPGGTEGPSPTSAVGAATGGPVSPVARSAAEELTRYGWFCPAGPGCSSSGRSGYLTKEAADLASYRHVAEVHGYAPLQPFGVAMSDGTPDAPSTPSAALVPAAHRPEVAGVPESGQDSTAGREAAQATVWISQLDDALIVHASQAGAQAAAITAWQAVRYDDDPDGPYTWQPNEEQAGAADLVIDTGALILHTGFRVYPAPVHQP